MPLQVSPNFLNQSLANGYLGCFQSLAIKRVRKRISMCNLLDTYVNISVGEMSRCVIDGSKGIDTFTFLIDIISSPLKMLNQLLFSWKMNESACFLQPLVKLPFCHFTKMWNVFKDIEAVWFVPRSCLLRNQKASRFWEATQWDLRILWCSLWLHVTTKRKGN